MTATKVSKEQLSTFFAEEFPQADIIVDAVGNKSATLRKAIDHRHLRPGGTVSGPSMFGLADVCVYAMVLSRIGRQALAVTTNCSIDFMRKPAAGADLIATGQLLKLGRVLAIGDVHLRSEGSPDLVARATLTYSIPPAR